MTTISVRLSEEELAYLEAIARNKKINKSSKQGSPGKALKQLIKWCVDNEIDIVSSYEKPEDSSRKLLEQLHVTIPHILYLSRLHILMDSNKVPDDVVSKTRQQAIDYINLVCGDFQNMEYSEVKPSCNEVGLKQLSVEKESSSWKVIK